MRSSSVEQDGTREVRGSVTAAGAVTFGTGFTVTKTGVGNYQLRFSPPFRATPAIVATTVAQGNITMAIQSPTPEGVLVATIGGASGSVADWNFDFIARGRA